MGEVIRKERDDGEVFYTLKSGNEVNVYHQSFEEIFGNILERFEGFFDLMKATDGGGFEIGVAPAGYIGSALVRDAKRIFYNAYEFAKDEFGEIEVAATCYNQSGVENNRLVGVRFREANGDQKGKKVYMYD